MWKRLDAILPRIVNIPCHKFDKTVKYKRQLNENTSLNLQLCAQKPNKALPDATFKDVLIVFQLIS